MTRQQLRLADFVPYRLSVAANRVSNHIATAYEALFGLTIPQWRVVAIVAERAGTTQAAICRLSGMDKVTVSRAAIALVDRALIARDAHARDGRSRELRLTDAGQTLYAEVAPKALELEADLLAGFTGAEVATLAALLGRLGDAVPDGRDEPSRGGTGG